MSLSHAQRLAEGHGARLEAQEGEAREALWAGAGSAAAGPTGRLYVTLEATKTLFLDGWHETRVGAVYGGEPDETGIDVAGETTDVSGVQEEPARFGERLYQEAQRQGVAQAREVVVVADGALWIWNVAAEHFPERAEVLDFYHAAERLHAVGNTVYGEGRPAARRWAEVNKARLLAGQVAAVLRSWRALRPRHGEGREAVRRALHYFHTNRHRMRYADYRARGYHIGSGVVEAGCQCVLATRCQRSGRRGSRAGAPHLLSLRSLLLHGRWDQYRQPLKAAA